MSADIQALNDLHAVIGELRVARALVWDTVRGTNDIKFDLCKDWDRAIERAEKAYKVIRQLETRP